MLAKQTWGNYPAQKHILSAVYEGLIVPIDAALRIESRYFVKTLMTPEAKGMIRSLFLSMQELSKGASRPAGYPKYDIKKAVVIGAGIALGASGKRQSEDRCYGGELPRTIHVSGYLVAWHRRVFGSLRKGYAG